MELKKDQNGRDRLRVILVHDGGLSAVETMYMKVTAKTVLCGKQCGVSSHAGRVQVRKIGRIATFISCPSKPILKTSSKTDMGSRW